MKRLTNNHSDCLIGADGLNDTSLLHFWQWAFGDLCDDDWKGVFAEWLVHKLLGIPSSRRISWANSDVLTPEGVRIEVKATSYWQSWKLLNEQAHPYDKPLRPLPLSDSKIRFGGLTARDATTVVDMSKARALKSHIYVFAFQHEKDVERWNAMDLSQWEFYVVRAGDLPAIAGRTVALGRLRPTYGPLTAPEFVTRAKAMIAEVAGELHA